MKLTYRTLPYDDDYDDVERVNTDTTQAGETPDADTHNRTQWDEDCPWSEWYSAEDPVKGNKRMKLLLLHV